MIHEFLDNISPIGEHIDHRLQLRDQLKEAAIQLVEVEGQLNSQTIEEIGPRLKEVRLAYDGLIRELLQANDDIRHGY